MRRCWLHLLAVSAVLATLLAQARSQSNLGFDYLVLSRCVALRCVLGEQCACRLSPRRRHCPKPSRPHTIASTCAPPSGSGDLPFARPQHATRTRSECSHMQHATAGSLCCCRKTGKLPTRSASPALTRSNLFTIHGLWPNNDNGNHPAFCDDSDRFSRDVSSRAGQQGGLLLQSLHATLSAAASPCQPPSAARLLLRPA